MLLQKSPAEQAGRGVCFATSLNSKDLDEVHGRDTEIDRMIEVLCRRDKSNPILVGEAGVGKTSVVHGLVNRIKAGNVPEKLMGKKVVSLDLSVLADNLSHITAILSELSDSIIFIDEIHNVVGAGRTHGSLDLSNVMKPLLTSGEVTCIGATTFDEYQKYIESDSALTRRFQKVVVQEPSSEDTVEILKRCISKYEFFHRIKISDAAIESAVKLSQKYLTDQRLPDKAFDLLDEASSRLAVSLNRLNQAQVEMERLLATGDYEKASEYKYSLIPEIEKKSRRVLDPYDIEQLISDKTGIPVTRLNEDEKQRLLLLEDRLNSRVLGQRHVMKAVSDSLITSRLGLKKTSCSFMFLGPTGVGKTETVKSVAEALFGSEKAMVRLDMSEYMEKHSVSKLIGAPAGYVGYEEGGQLTEAVKRKPYCVILLDEVEKAHPDVFNVFLQVLDDGRLTDNKGHTVDFSNTIIAMTSNLRKENLTEHFRPEFLNRIDAVLSFNALSEKELYSIAEKELAHVHGEFKKQYNVHVKPSESLIQEIVGLSQSEVWGARHLKRLIHELVVVPVSKKIIKGEIAEASVILLEGGSSATAPSPSEEI